ncbi:hypothetical protein PQR11_04450 [Paraburkholderia strydomiana]|uniref:hypothetical protein n=1 Tax=Paraburkholderia strydomiana TaxID=1245417 RepID=UPI0038BB6501
MFAHLFFERAEGVGKAKISVNLGRVPRARHKQHPFGTLGRAKGRWRIQVGLRRRRGKKVREPLRPKQYGTRRVLCIEIDEVFASLTAAGRAKGISSSHITSICKGRRKQAGGLTWEYVLPDNGEVGTEEDCSPNMQEDMSVT